MKKKYTAPVLKKIDSIVKMTLLKSASNNENSQHTS